MGLRVQAASGGGESGALRLRGLLVHSALSGPQHRGEGLAAARAALAQARVCPGPLCWPPGARGQGGAQVREAERRRGFCFPATRYPLSQRRWWSVGEAGCSK